MPFQLHQRLDVKDTTGKWLEAQIIDLNNDFIKIHYKGWASKFDEYIPISSQQLDTKYAEVGKYSSAFGYAKFSQVANHAERNHALKQDDESRD